MSSIFSSALSCKTKSLSYAVILLVAGRSLSDIFYPSFDLIRVGPLEFVLSARQMAPFVVELWTWYHFAMGMAIARLYGTFNIMFDHTDS